MRHFFRSTLSIAVASAMLTLLPGPADALIYLPENTLESMLLRADSVLIATVTDLNPATNRGTLAAEETLKGPVGPATLPIAGVMLQIDTNVQKPRFAKGDRIVIFLGPLNATTGTRAVIHSQTLANDAEVRTMRGCIAEIMPLAPLLADLADVKKEIRIEPVHAALLQMAGSKNGYTEIILGRLMSTRLAQRLKPEGMEDVLIPALTSTRKELAQGALTWTARYTKLPASIRTALTNAAAASAEPDFKKSAAALLGK